MTVTRLVLDDYEFEDFEIPDRINWGGRQALSIKKLVGGVRIIEAMGADDDPISWEGRFRGPEAVARARFIDGKRKAGKPVALFWNELAFTVVIERFEPDFTAPMEVPYRICCEVLQDEAAPVTSLSTPTVDDAIASDLETAEDLTAGIGDSTLTSLMGGVSAAVGKVTTFLGATQDVLTSVLEPIASVQNRVTFLISEVEAVTGGALGGVISGALGRDLAPALTAQVSSMTRGADLFDLQSTLGRMTTNLESVGLAGAQVVMAGGDLFRLAADTYGDAMEWATIARANGLADPLVTGVQTLLVPPIALGADGVLAP